ncbi:MAG TPA: hypothetical protein VN643_10575 [Pyrinomonadaceae bacterium]|nr:hypothetical protein [Pyrinomonadaceae bacterium]
MPAAKKKVSDGGTVFRGSDGSLYFVRDELLDALRVEDEGLERLEETMKGGAKAATKDTGSIKPVAYVKGALLRQDPRNQAVALKATRAKAKASTIMCPWFC